MENKKNKQIIIFTISFLLLFIFTLFFSVPYKVSAVCNLSEIRNNYSSRGLSGSGIEQESIDNCLREQRKQDQQVRNQMKADAESAQAFYQIKLDFFYKLDVIEKQIETLNSSDSNYSLYKLGSIDCAMSMEIPSDPTSIDPNIFLSLIGNKEKCVDYLLQYIAPKTNTIQTQKPAVTNPTQLYPIRKPTRTNNQICKDKFGQSWEWDGTINDKGGLSCGCKDGYTQSNGGGQCITNDQSCNITYPNSFSKINDAGSRVCSCRNGYSWDQQGTSCVVAPIVPKKTNNQICQDSYGLNSAWDGTRNNEGGLICDCKTGYEWNQGQTQCISIPKTKAVMVIPSVPVPKIEPKVTAPIIKKILEIKKVKRKIKENTFDDPILNGERNSANVIASVDSGSISLDKKVATSTEKTKSKSLWASIKIWFSFFGLGF